MTKQTSYHGIRQYASLILSLLGDDKKKLYILLVLFLAGSLLDLLGIGLIGPYFAIIFDKTALSGNIGKTISFFGFPNDQQSLVFIGGTILILVFLLKAIFGIFINYKITNFGQEEQVRLRSVMMRSFQSLPYSDYINRNSSEYIHSLQSLVVQYTDNALIPSLKTISDLIVATFIIGYLAFTNIYVLLLLVSLLTLLVLGYDKLFRKKVSIYGEKSNKAATLLVQGIQEGIQGLAEIRILKKEAYFHRRVVKQSKEFAINQAKTRILTTSSRFLVELLLISFVVFLIFIIVAIGHDLQTLIPILAIFGVASLRLLPSATALSSNLVKIRFARDAVILLSKDFDYIKSVDFKKTESNTGVKPTIDDFSILKVNDISYRYGDAKNKAIKNISLEVKKGEAIGIIGSSGSGKTTLINLLLGLFNPDSGDIIYNKTLLKENKENWQRRIAYIPQNLLLVDDSLKNNIALGVNEEDIDDKRLEESISLASLANVVKELKYGVDTPLGERGVRLSGGQRQRVILARAFYHNRDILIMDESTSSLDNETEQEIIREIKKFHGIKTMIVIAHRHSTVAHCDRIYKIDGGKVIGVGTPENMLKSNVL
jgi:ATP-binding cassette, subfamily B, bacterial PglK